MTKPASFLLSDWSWSWWSSICNSTTATEELVRLCLTLSVLLPIAWFWFAWLSKRRDPPAPPGPWGLPLVGHLPFLDPELHSYFAGLARAHGPVVKLMLGNKVAVVVTSAGAAREVLKDHDITFANRDMPAVAPAATYGGADIVWKPYGPEWRMLRKVCVREMLGSATLDAVYSLRRREVRRTVGYFYSRAGSPVKVGEQVFLTVLNVITNLLWGGTVKGEARESLGAEFRQLVMGITALLGKPNISDFFPVLARFDLQGIVRKMEVLAERFDRIFRSVIDQRLKMDGEGGREAADHEMEGKDFLQILLHMKDGGDPKTPFTMTHVKALLMDMVVGGTETSSNTVEFAMAEVMNKPEIMRKAQQELDAIVGRDSTVEESHIPNLPYLQAIMKETLRLHPALPLLVPHCPSEPCTVGGYAVPKGARVFVNVWAIQRDPSVWDDPTRFDPDRFLSGKGDYSGNDFNYFPFGSGRRICAGVAMAERSVMYSLASLLHSFEWKLPEGDKLELSEKFGIVLKKRAPLVAIPTPRLSDPRLYE